jgi:hypothetical protein
MTENESKTEAQNKEMGIFQTLLPELILSLLLMTAIVPTPQVLLN